SLSGRIYLLDFLKKSFANKDNGHLDHVLHRHRNAATHTTVDDINTKEKQWWKDSVTNEQQILDAVEDLHPFYAAVWDDLTDMEKFTLYDFALDGFTNYKNKATLTGLLNKRILRIEGERLRFMTPGFREWVLRTPDDIAFAVINDRARQEGTWEHTKRY